nr:MAG TPA: hypothetical protein [Bacteriophage sp.]
MRCDINRETNPDTGFCRGTITMAQGLCDVNLPKW